MRKTSESQNLLIMLLFFIIYLLTIYFERELLQIKRIQTVTETQWSG